MRDKKGDSSGKSLWDWFLRIIRGQSQPSSDTLKDSVADLKDPVANFKYPVVNLNDLVVELKDSAAKLKDSVAELKDPVTESSRENRNLLIASSAFFAYVAVIAASTTDLKLFIPDSKVNLPLLGVEVSLLMFYKIIPFIVVIFHLNMLLNLFFHAQKLENWLQSTGITNSEAKEFQMFPFLFNYGVQYSSDNIIRRVTPFIRCVTQSGVQLITWVSYYAYPLAVLAFIAIKFIPYHDSTITNIHKTLITFDALLLSFLWPLIVCPSRDFHRFSESGKGLRGRLKTFMCNAFVFFKGVKPHLIFSAIIIFYTWTAISIPDKKNEFIYFPNIENIKECFKMGGLKRYKDIFLVPTDKIYHQNLDLQEKTLVAKEPGDTIIQTYTLKNKKDAWVNKEDAWKDYAVGYFLKGRNLKFAHFNKSNLSKANLSGTQMQGADLSESILQGADLSNSNLQGATLSLAKLQGADLSGAHLQAANLTLSNLQGADLAGSHLQVANLSFAKLQGTNLSSAHLQGTNLSSAKIRGVNLSDAELQGANFDDATIVSAWFNKTKLKCASFKNVHIENTFSDHNNIEADVEWDKIKNEFSTEELEPRKIIDAKNRCSQTITGSTDIIMNLPEGNKNADALYDIVSIEFYCHNFYAVKKLEKSITEIDRGNRPKHKNILDSMESNCSQFYYKIFGKNEEFEKTEEQNNNRQ